MGGRKAQGGHLPLCDRRQGLSTSELEFLSHRVDRAMPLLLSPWLVVTTRQPPGWLGGWGWSPVFAIHSPQKPPQIAHSAV